MTDEERNREFRLKAIDALACLGTALVAQNNVQAAKSSWGEEGAASALSEYQKALSDFVTSLKELVDDEKRS